MEVGARNAPVGAEALKLASVRARLLEAVQAPEVPGLAKVPRLRAQGPGLAWAGVDESDREVRDYPNAPIPCPELSQYPCRFLSGITPS